MPQTPVPYDALASRSDAARPPPAADEHELALADGDHTLSDVDQTSSDSDQTSSDSDQWAADRDQAASDRDLASGVDASEHDRTREVREHSSRQRARSSEARLTAATDRDEAARARDLAALARDRAASARDLAMAQRDAAYEQEASMRSLPGAATVTVAAEQRRRAAENRAQAAEHRALAARDRLAAAQDREQAARERARARADRDVLARELAIAETDPLTGVRSRAAGLADLECELDRCRRSKSTLVLAYVDIIGLKGVNDFEGHSAGDALIQRVVAFTRKHLRSYDLIVRIGGDEFVCAMSSMTSAEARQRFEAIAAELAAAPSPAAIRTGFAELMVAETATELIRRADRELIAGRNGSDAKRSHTSPGSPGPPT